MGKRAERKQDIHDLFPASLLGLFICCYRCEWDPSWRNRDREVTFEFQWRLVKVHQSPAPTHPRSRVSLSQWKLLAPEWEAGSSSEKKKKVLSASLIVPLLETRFSSKLTKLTFLLSANLWLSTVVDRTAGKLTRVHEVRHLQWLLKIPPRLEHVLCKQVLAQKTRQGT